MGMLTAKVYLEIYNRAKQLPEGNIVEVGTCHGSVTIALALGIKESFIEGRVYSFDKLTGGNRKQFGDEKDNLKIVLDNFKKYHVKDYITMIVGYVEDEYEKNADEIGRNLTALILDADGRIDRDFRYFYNALKPGALIVIDDYEDKVKIKYDKSNAVLDVDMKHKLTYELVNLFKKAGLLEVEYSMGKTVFAKKPDNITHFVNFNDYDVTGAYAKMKHTWTKYSFDHMSDKKFISKLKGKGIKGLTKSALRRIGLLNK